MVPVIFLKCLLSYDDVSNVNTKITNRNVMRDDLLQITCLKSAEIDNCNQQHIT